MKIVASPMNNCHNLPQPIPITTISLSTPSLQVMIVDGCDYMGVLVVWFRKVTAVIRRGVGKLLYAKVRENDRDSLGRVVA